MSHRGAIVVVALPGDYGKPRPALVVQADDASDLPSRIVCPLTSDVHLEATLYRPVIEPTVGNGLRGLSQVMLDKPHVVSMAKIGPPVGTLEPDRMAEVNIRFAQLLGLL